MQENHTNQADFPIEVQLPKPASGLPRLLVMGVGPLPPESPERLYAPGLRVWGMARALARAGHPVTLATTRFSEGSRGGLRVNALTPGGAIRPRPLDSQAEIGLEGAELHFVLARLARESGAEALISTSDIMNREAALIPGDLPLWCDYFGDPMAERQMLAYLHGSDAGLADQWEMLAPALRRGDRFSGCSRRQVGAIEGEMATVGRLNRHTVALRPVQLIRPWIEPIRPAAGEGPFLKGVSVPHESYVILQTGGFNSWLDVETLFAALETAMKARPEIHFAATGGGIAGHNNLTLERFQVLIAGSPYRDRYHLLGWVPLAHVPRIIAEADMGLNADLPCLEGWLGTRNRIMDWVMGDLPVVATIGCELAEDLAENGLIIGVEQRNPVALAEAILESYSNREAGRERAKKARGYLELNYSPERSLRPLLEWAKKPQRSPDLEAWTRGETAPPELWLQAHGEARIRARLEAARGRLTQADSHLKTLQGSSLVRAALAVRRLFRGPLR